MAKIMLVEDDNNLREIYEARLLAEGYQIVSARDGEEALALAVKEKPDLIISDVMMPKISGFDMLDILRSTPETKNTKVIMMTALSQAEDQARAGKLGADRYLIKSQVTLEDVAKVAREVLMGEPAPSQTEPTAPSTLPEPSTDPGLTPATPPQLTPVEVPVAAVPTTPPADMPSQFSPPQPTFTPVEPPADNTATNVPVMPPAEPAADPVAASPTMPQPAAYPAPDPVAANPIIPSASIDPGLSQTVQAEEAVVDTQISTFADQLPVEPPAEAPAPAPAEESLPETAPATTPDTSSSTPVDNPTETPIPNPVEVPSVEPPAATPEASINTPPATDESATNQGNGNIAGKRIIQPPADTDTSASHDLQELLKQEEAKENQSGTTQAPPQNPANDPNSIAL